MINPSEDGTSHINIYSKANTRLGKLLSNWARIPFVHPEDGAFQSIEGYWYWLKCKNDALRHLYGWEAKRQGRELSADSVPLSLEARSKIKEAIRLKVQNSPELHRLMRENTLPYEHYYVYAGIVRQPASDKWLVEFIQQLSDELK